MEKHGIFYLQKNTPKKHRKSMEKAGTNEKSKKISWKKHGTIARSSTPKKHGKNKKLSWKKQEHFIEKHGKSKKFHRKAWKKQEISWKSMELQYFTCSKKDLNRTIFQQ